MARHQPRAASIAPSDAFILARTSKRTVALAADAVDSLLERSQEDVVASSAILQNAPYLEGVVKLADGLVLIHDLNSFLSLDEERELERST